MQTFLHLQGINPLKNTKIFIKSSNRLDYPKDESVFIFASNIQKKAYLSHMIKKGVIVSCLSRKKMKIFIYKKTNPYI